MSAEKWRSGARLAASARGGKEPAPSASGLARMDAIAEAQRGAKDEFWRKVLSDPQTYGDELLKARALVAHYSALLARAKGRLDYLQSLSIKEP